MKKLFALALVLAFLAGFTSCVEPEPPTMTTQPTTEFKFMITLYLPNENVDGFVTKTVEFDGAYTSIVALLVAQGALPEGCAALSLEIDGKGHATLDMNAAYGAAINQMGTAGELMMLGSLVNTFIGFHQLDDLFVTVEGKTLITGHNEYDEPLTFYN